jgi:hypothetical protein
LSNVNPLKFIYLKELFLFINVRILIKFLNYDYYERYMKSKDDILCPKCHKKISAEDNFCPFCGQKIHKKIKLHKNVEISLSPKNIFLFIMGLLVIILVVLWLSGLIPICGDGLCLGNECATGCKDCGPEKCLDGLCQPQSLELCSNTDDCACDVHEVCASERENVDNKGCYIINCGDGFCDSKKEDITNCCLDCDCNEGYECNIEKNECLFDPPSLIIDEFEVINKLSASTLFSNKNLIDDDGNNHTFLRFKVLNEGSNIAKNTVISIDMSYYTDDDSISFGNLESLESDFIEWNPVATQSMLSIKDTKDATITVTFMYEDEHGIVYEKKESIPVEILGRNNWDWTYASWSQFVTPQDPIVREAVSSAGSFSTQDSAGINYAAQEVWEFLGNLDIDYISDPNKEYIQYPAEVLNNKRGDCDDLAIMYVALLEAIGIQTAVIEIPGHLFAAYFDGQYIYPIETTMIGSDFADALDTGTEQYDNYAEIRKLVEIELEWHNKSINPPASVGVSNLDFPNIDVDIAANSDWKCEYGESYCELWQLKINCDLNFVNSGNAEGQKCVTVYVYKDDIMVKSDNICETIPANDNVETRVRYTQNYYDTFGFNYYCTYE